jgi:hypothetical protein
LAGTRYFTRPLLKLSAQFFYWSELVSLAGQAVKLALA